MAEKKRKKRKHFSKLMQKKLVGSFALVLFVLLGLNLRIVYITAKNGDNYAKQVLSQKQYDSRTIPYKRGEIQDRNGNVFAKSEKVYNVILDCVAVNGGDEEEQAKLKEQEIDYIEPTIDRSSVQCNQFPALSALPVLLHHHRLPLHSRE